MNLKESLERLLAGIGVQGEPLCEPLPGGKNNRVFRIRAGGRLFFLKSYFSDPSDRRERLKTEFLFSRFLWDNGIRDIPHPLAEDSEHRLGLYDFVEGVKIPPEEVTPVRVEQALEFFLAINRHRGLETARRIPEASEARFTPAGHLELVRSRVERLQKIGGEGECDREARAFAGDVLPAEWEKARKTIESVFPEHRSAPKAISPSDFGFHNALLTPGGRVCFHDFEYAGWDDPARTVCEFFCQPEVPVPPRHFEPFAGAVADFFGDTRGLERARLLLPLYRIKWCCTLLNEFLEEGGRRRRFAAGEESPEEAKGRQLAKAKAYWGEDSSSLRGFPKTDRGRIA